ncbi:MAG TPA: energy-coupling factor transporter transmembrane component T, partial [Anaerolineaceae bacterium]|nr:energy-coupling factor transporter transmembrane component T [Anaerolineaceae bacterium]
MLASLNYRPRGSVVERIDPRARWIYSLAMVFSIVFFWDIRFLLFFFALALLQYALSNLTWREARRAWFFIFFIATMMVVVNTLITSAGTISQVTEGPAHPVLVIDTRLPLINLPISFTLTAERLWYGLCQYIRILSISLLFLVLPFTLDPRKYGITFRGLGASDRLAYSMDLAFRFLPTLNRDFNVTVDAQRARGYELERAQGGLFAQIRKMAPLMVPVTMNAILEGEDIINAMDLRCFGLRPR